MTAAAAAADVVLLLVCGAGSWLHACCCWCVVLLVCGVAGVVLLVCAAAGVWCCWCGAAAWLLACCCWCVLLLVCGAAGVVLLHGCLHAAAGVWCCWCVVLLLVCGVAAGVWCCWCGAAAGDWCCWCVVLLVCGAAAGVWCCWCGAATAAAVGVLLLLLVCCWCCCSQGKGKGPLSFVLPRELVPWVHKWLSLCHKVVHLELPARPKWVFPGPHGDMHYSASFNHEFKKMLVRLGAKSWSHMPPSAFRVLACTWGLGRWLDQEVANSQQMQGATHMMGNSPAVVHSTYARDAHHKYAQAAQQELGRHRSKVQLEAGLAYDGWVVDGVQL